MATYFEIVFTGQPTEADFERVAELAAQGFTGGQLINDEPGAGMHQHDGYAPHSHEVRPDHRGVKLTDESAG